jgi:GTP cyclohydrolase I
MPAGTGVDRPRIERAVREILLAIGEDAGRERLAEAYASIFSAPYDRHR